MMMDVEITNVSTNSTERIFVSSVVLPLPSKIYFIQVAGRYYKSYKVKVKGMGLNNFFLVGNDGL